MNQQQSNSSHNKESDVFNQYLQQILSEPVGVQKKPERLQRKHRDETLPSETAPPPRRQAETPSLRLFEPHNDDVICAKGKQYHDHLGNRKFRAMILMNAARYRLAKTKVQKGTVVMSIVRHIRHTSPHGFIRHHEGKWQELGDQLAREKVGHALRDAVKAKERASRRMSGVVSIPLVYKANKLTTTTTTTTTKVTEREQPKMMMTMTVQQPQPPSAGAFTPIPIDLSATATGAATTTPMSSSPSVVAFDSPTRPNPLGTSSGSAATTMMMMEDDEFPLFHPV